MESTEGRYGWAADDPRWTDARAGGQGRLEPSPPPTFGAADLDGAPSGDGGPDLTPIDATTGTSTTGVPTSSIPEAPSVGPGGPPPVTTVRPLNLPPWPPPPPIPNLPAPAPPPAPALSPLPRRDLFGPPLAITAAPASPPEPTMTPGPTMAPPSSPSAPEGQGAAAPSPPPAPTWVPSAVPTAIPLRLNTRPGLPGPTAGALPGPTGVGLRTGYGLGTAVTAGTGDANGTMLRRDVRPTRLERRVRIRSRWRADDEFRQAGRAELFSDDARYQVLFALTAIWYAPVAVIGLLWVLLVSGDGTLAGALSGLAWLAFAAGVSMAIAGLLRWASVGWRAITLSIASALIGGGLTTIAYTLTG